MGRGSCEDVSRTKSLTKEQVRSSPSLEVSLAGAPKLTPAPCLPTTGKPPWKFHFIAPGALAVALTACSRSFSGPGHLIGWGPCLLTRGPAPPAPPAGGGDCGNHRVESRGDRDNGAKSALESPQPPFWKLRISSWGVQLPHFASHYNILCLRYNQ